MGTLIIFIALVLTAAVAAAVLISTISSLQSRSLETGKTTTQEVGTNLNVLQIYGDREGTDNTVKNLTLVVKLAAGSQDVRFNDLLITLSLDNSRTDYAYSEDDILGTGNYTVSYSIDGSGHVANYLVKGDVANVKLNAPTAIAESGSIKLSLVPRVGTPAYVYASVPDTINVPKVLIFP